MNEKTITVTSPLIPPLSEFIPYLEDIWRRKWLTNNGHYHQELEKALAEYLGVKYISLFTNGTLPLMTALQALRISGEVITTPFSFVATTHSLWWNGIRPVFVDIDPETCNLDPAKIEAAITPRTTAIMPVHVYGRPCDTDQIQEIASRYGLKVIYDAAHAFGVESHGASILKAGDMSTLSFHATKAYSTIEGGALVCHDEATKKRIDYLKNFGFADEVTVMAPGINAKMDEVRAAYGLLGLKHIDAAIARRRELDEVYRQGLKRVAGLRVLEPPPNVRMNYSYFPVFVDNLEYGQTRDELYERLKRSNVLGRRYFYPLISNFSTYRELPSAAPDRLPVANKLAAQVICLPLHHEMTEDDVSRVIGIVTKAR